MKIIDYVILGIVLLIIGSALLYIRRAKKKGVKCIGCPDGVKCSDRCSGCSGNCCGCNSDES